MIRHEAMREAVDAAGSSLAFGEELKVGPVVTWLIEQSHPADAAIQNVKRESGCP